MKIRWWITLIALLVAGAAAVALWPAEREPLYKGKKLSWWLARYTQTLYDGGDETNPVALEAREAVIQIGTNAVPKLMEWMSGSRQSLRRVERIRSRFHLPFSVYYVIGFFYRSSPTDHNTLAVYGFSILGERAAQAVPELSRMLKETNVVHDAVLCLARMGKPGFDKLVTALGDTNQMDRPYIAMLVGDTAVGSMTNAGEATAPLLQCAQEGDPELVAAALRALGKLRSGSSRIMPMNTP